MKLCFFLGVYQDQILAERCIDGILSAYDKDEVDLICFSDGIENHYFRTFCEHRQVPYFVGKRLKLAAFGGMWILRMLEAFFHVSNADLLVRVEPDSLIQRQFLNIPKGDVIGNIRQSQDFNYVQGGCVGLTRSACTKILESCFLFDSLYTHFSYNRYQPPYLQPNEIQSTEELIAVDIILSHVAQRAGLKLVEWDEVCCFTFRQDLDNALAGMSHTEILEKYAVLHPCKG